MAHARFPLRSTLPPVIQNSKYLLTERLRQQNSKFCLPVSTYSAIYAVVRQIPKGRVATYGQVATLANLPGQARLVGYALYRLDARSSEIPWQRVVNAKGEISQSPRRYGADAWQRNLLEAEGIEFSVSGKINLSDYRWRPALPLMVEGAGGLEEAGEEGRDE